MAIGIVSREEFEAELRKLRGGALEESATEDGTRTPLPIDAEVIPVTPSRGRKEGDVNTPDSLRKIIADTHLMDGREAALSLAADFGISPSSVSAYANGATSCKTYHEPSSSLSSHLNKTRARAVKRAQKTLNGALSAITQEKLDYSDAKDLSGIAKDMSVIIKNLEPAIPEVSDNKTPQFVIFAPSFRDERTFETITVNE